METKRVWRDRLHDVSAVSSLVMISAPYVIGAITMVWSWLANEPPITMWIYSLIAFVGVVWARNGLVWWQQHQHAGTVRASPPKNRAQSQGDALRTQDADDLEVLLGTWNVVIIHNEPIRAPWIFAADQKMLNIDGTACGTWELTPTEVLITWDSYQSPPNASAHCWETFTRPLDPFGVTGKSWRPDAEVRANKVIALASPLRESNLAASPDPGVFAGR